MSTLVPQENHPWPQRRRRAWRSLEGPWDFAMERRAAWAVPADVRWGPPIQVPFAPETSASGIGDPGYHEVCWYRRVLEPTALGIGERLVVHFNAVDYHAKVWANDCYVTEHEGGYTPFTADVTDFVRGGRPVTLVVRAQDDPFDLAKPRGKQDWQLESHSIWYPRTSGIWQTVWSERLPETWIDTVRWTPNLERWELGLEVRLGGRPRDDLRLRVDLSARDTAIASDIYSVTAGEVSRRIALSDPGIDDYRNIILWSPHSPTLILARLELTDTLGRVMDRVSSYTALRSVAVQGQTVVLNGRPYPLRLVLDQGYWPDTGLTPPDPDALRHDVELVKRMGFNGVRKHQKIEDPRYLYWADRMGLLVWTEMPSAYRFTTRAIRRITREWLEILERDYSHPSVICWVPFNESWGVPNLPEVPAQRGFVQALYHLTRTLDTTRPVVGNDGWESTATDIIGIHDYDDSPERIAARYKMQADLPALFRRERPGGRMLLLEGQDAASHPVMLTEFGGIAYGESEKRDWGYSSAGSPKELEDMFCSLMNVVRKLPTIAGFCYTQFTDTYQEKNGLLFFDRTPKIPLEKIAEATRGVRRKRRQAAADREVANATPDEGPVDGPHESAAP